MAKILVIDDDPGMRTILSLSLKLFGYAIFVAGNGEDAVAIAREHPEIRVVILDVVMSGLSANRKLSSDTISSGNSHITREAPHR